MAVSTHLSGSQTCVVGTEHVLNTTTPETTVGVFQLLLDLNTSAKDDLFEIRIKEKIRDSSGTQRTITTMTVQHDLSDDGWVSPPYILLNGWDMTIKQTAGTGRVVPWSIRKVV